MNTSLSFARLLAIAWSVLFALGSNCAGEVARSTIGPDRVLGLAEKVADWQLNNPAPHPARDWTQAAFYAGVMALSEISKSDRFRAAMREVGERNDWKMGPRTFHADDHAVGQMYIEMYLKTGDARCIQNVITTFDAVLKKPWSGDLNCEKEGAWDQWVWCDALFMSPPALARLSAATGDPRYLQFMVEKWEAVRGYLYDQGEHLYYRDSRFFTRREANGQKVFWSRGNGWVVAGLARVLMYMPPKHPARPRFEAQFRQMCDRLIELQQTDGFWHSSLLDPASYPMKETSGTAFHCFALAWGVNAGLLDKPRYSSAALRAWTALASCVTPEGKLTRVQPIGETPTTFDPESTDVFAVGAFLLASTQTFHLAEPR